MLNRKVFPESVMHKGTCQVSGDTGMVLVKSNGQWVIPEIKAEHDREKVKPTDRVKYEAWKDEFDRWTGV